MKITVALIVLIGSVFFVSGLSVDDPFSRDKMRKDLSIFKQIREQANSGLYKYRTKAQIDSSYSWAEKEIDNATSYLDFYNLICQLTDFEGSLHNDTDLPEKYLQSLREEPSGYFPYPLKWVHGKWRVNFSNEEIPLGSAIVSINDIPIAKVMQNLYKYYTTDGDNVTGKRIGLRAHFSKFFRWHYGQMDRFQVTFIRPDGTTAESTSVQSVGYVQYYRNFLTRHSKPDDQIYYTDLKVHQKYHYEKLDAATGIFTIYDLEIGANADAEEHKAYVTFLDSIFKSIRDNNLVNLIVDVRHCGGGTDPNDVVTYSYLTSRTFQESKQVWSSFQKLPYLKYYDSPFPRFLRPLGVGKYNKQFRKRFPNAKDGKYYIGEEETEMMVRSPNTYNFTGNIYLLISPGVASAGSLFSAMLAGNENTTTIGEETMGGYYGHNGHTALEYVLPKSKLEFSFFMDNIEQDVPKKFNQIYGRGVIPDYEVAQTLEDFLHHEDTQLNFVIELIKGG